MSFFSCVCEKRISPQWRCECRSFSFLPVWWWRVFWGVFLLLFSTLRLITVCPFFVKRLLVDPVSFWQWETSHWTVEWNKHQPQLRVKGACVCKLHLFIFPVFFRQKEHSHSPARPSAVCSCDVNGKLLQVRVLLAAWVLCGSFHSWSFLFDGSLFFFTWNVGCFGGRTLDG